MKNRILLIGLLFLIIGQLNAQDFVQIQNRWQKDGKTDYKIHIQNENVDAGATESNWWSAQWTIEKVKDSEYYRIKNRWQKYGDDLYLLNNKEDLSVGEVEAGWWSAMWILEKMNGEDFYRIKNRWTNNYLHIQNPTLSCGKIDANWWSAMWELQGFDINNVPESIVNTTTPKPTIKTVELEKAILCKNESGGSQVFPDEISTASIDVIWKINVAGYVEKSTDGGKKWNDSDKKLKALSAVNEQVAYGITWNGQTELTTDGGKSWTQVGNGFEKISSIDAMNVWAIDGYRNVFHSNNGGQDWTNPSVSADNISATFQGFAWTVNAGTLFRTKDGGKTMEEITTKVKTVSALNYENTWILNQDNTLQYTNNGGKSWNKVEGYFHKVQAVSADQAHVIDAQGNLVLLSMLK